jgi:hypothetical protein
MVEITNEIKDYLEKIKEKMTELEMEEFRFYLLDYEIEQLEDQDSDAVFTLSSSSVEDYAFQIFSTYSVNKYAPERQKHMSTVRKVKFDGESISFYIDQFSESDDNGRNLEYDYPSVTFEELMEGLDENATTERVETCLHNLLFEMKVKEVVIANQTLPCIEEFEPGELTEEEYQEYLEQTGGQEIFYSEEGNEENYNDQEEDTEDNEINIEEELANVGKGVKNLFSSIYNKLK